MRWMALLPLLALPSLAWSQDRGARADDVAFTAEDQEEQPLPPKHRLWYTQAAYARVNPLGLIELYKAGWRRRVWNKPGLLFDDTYTWLAGSATVSPAWGRLGLHAEAQPIALLRVFGEVGVTGWFGTFDQVLSWSDPAAKYSDQTIADEGDRATPRYGTTVLLGGALRAKVGPVALRSTMQVQRHDLNLPDGDAYFYDQVYDRLAPDGGWMILNDLDVLVISGKARVGARYTFTDGLDGQGDANDGALSNHRVGPLFAWQFNSKPAGARYNEPTLFVLAQWWVQHPYRTGAEQPQGLPLIAAGFAFNGDLLK